MVKLYSWSQGVPGAENEEVGQGEEEKGGCEDQGERQGDNKVHLFYAEKEGGLLADKT